MRYLLSLFLLYSINVSQIRDNPDQLFRIAQKQEQSGNYEKAKNIYKQLYSESPNNYNYFHGFVRTALSLKEYDLVIDISNSKLKQNPNDLSAIGILGTAYYRANQIEKADSIWDSAINNNTSDPNVYRTISNYAMQNRAFEKAEEILNAGAKKFPEQYLFSFDLAQLYSLSMNYESAAKEYCKILLKDQKRLSYVKNNLKRMNESESAKETIQKVFENCFENNKSVSVADVLIEIYLENSDLDKAYQLIIESDKISKNNGETIYRFAESARKSANYEVAINSYRYILNNFNSFLMHEYLDLNLAKSLIELNRKENNNTENWKPLRFNKVDSNKFSEPVSILENLLLTNKNRTLTNDILKTLADVYFYDFNEYKKSDSLYSIISQSKYGTEDYYQSNHNLGISALHKRKFEEAEKRFNEIVKSKRVKKELQEEASFYLSKIKFWKGKFSLAMTDLNKVAFINKSNFSNDAINLKLILGMFKKDSTNLAIYANADFEIFNQNSILAESLLKNLSENKNLFILNDLAKVRIIEILLAQNKFNEAKLLINNILSGEKLNIYAEKPMMYLGDIFYYSELDFNKAFEIYNNFLEKYPNSLYLSKIRENIKSIKEKLKNG